MNKLAPVTTMAPRAKSDEEPPRTPIQFAVRMVPLIKALGERALTFEEIIASRSMTDEEIRRLINRGPTPEQVQSEFQHGLESVDLTFKKVVREKDLEINRLGENVKRSKRDFDVKTGLANESFFRRQVVRHIIDRRVRNFAVVYLDVYKFKKFNDRLGHDKGDVVLKQVAKIIQNHLRPEDLAARFGGDEYAILLQNVDSREQAAMVIERIMKDLHAYPWDSHPTSLDMVRMRGLRPMLDPGVVFFGVPLERRKFIQPIRSRKYGRIIVDTADKLMYMSKRRHKKSGVPHICSGEVSFSRRSCPDDFVQFQDFKLQGKVSFCEVAA
jgi:diguanylate cyclase (GGDEF)-like protein